MSTVTHAWVMDALRRCYDPCCRDREISVVDMGPGRLEPHVAQLKQKLGRASDPARAAARTDGARES